MMVAMARVFLRKPSVFLLDDCLSALDQPSELQLLQVIGKILGQKNILFGSSRLRFVRNFERIVMMKKGKIMEEGSFEDLKQNTESYLNEYALEYNELLD
mmetsp:Transcript_952/g.961  ORF Transcript_952/g.961 Transcript_952/m.961 type:complete len:100 (-) Transcript_952:21-320(-)